MKKTSSFHFRLGLALAALSLLALPAVAQEEESRNWSDTAEFSYVMTSGNSETKTLGFKNTTTWTWERSLFEIRLGGIRADSTTETFYAVGTEEEYSYGSRSVTDKTAENYFFDARYERNVTDRFFWYGGVGWERNRFAGIDNRYVAQAGVGNIWFDEEDHKFKTNYALTYTDQEDVVELEDVDNSFIGARGSWEYMNKFGKNTTYENFFVLDLNLEEMSRYRWNMLNTLSVSMTDHLALKVGLRWLYEADPAYELVALYDVAPPLPPEPLPPVVEMVPRQLDKLDTIFTTSLVVNF
jgi:putative salt-induced outer membrane protein YdiY